MRRRFALATLLFSAATLRADEGETYFETHVRPLLVEHCLECHAADSEEVGGSLLLDSAAGWQAGGDSGPAVVAGDVDGSVLIEAVRYESSEMPPSGKLPAEAIAVFERWVAMGAPDPRTGGDAFAPSEVDVEAGREFWAFRPFERHEPPAAVEPEWGGAVDRFVAAKLTENDIRLPEKAAPATRLRRLHFDLTGLPPTPQDVRRFLADPSDEAFAAEADRLLASGGFGEHWGRHWLDVARYADSNGSDFNATHHEAWRYRDYVVDSLNADRPYDAFVRQQIAGDLLDWETNADRTRNVVATGFLAMGAKMLSERDKEKLRMDVVDEQIDTVGRAFLGMTLGCARCHDHKFDPVPTEDYYALAGIFRSTETIQGEIQQYVSDLVRVPLPADPEAAAAVARHEAEAAELRAALKRAEKALKRLQSSPQRLVAEQGGVLVDNDAAEFTGDWKPSSHSGQRVGKDYRHNDKRHGSTATYRFTLPSPGMYEVRLSYSLGGRDAAVPVTVTTAEGPRTVAFDQSRKQTVGGVFGVLGTFELPAEAAVTIGTEGTSGYVIADAVAVVPESAQTLDPPPAGGGLEAARDALAAAKTRLDEHAKNAPPPLPVALAVRDVQEPADCTMRIRGEHAREGDAVPRGFLQVAMTGEQLAGGPPAMPADASGRRELADWIASPDNPLTARVAVNRVWQHVFGEGLVRSVDNFGRLGERPSHPELLDTLAAEFVADGWSVKRLARRLVLSRAYASAPDHDAAAAAVDPDNRLLWRSHRRPLSAEQLRDAMLFIGGDLSRERPGETMRGVGKLVSKNQANDTSAQRADFGHVRTLYRPVVRNELDASLAAFDFADPEVSVGRRSRTNVPTQALYLMNSPFVRERAGAVAESTVGEGDAVGSLYLRVLSRKPTPDERRRVEAFVAPYDERSAGFRAAAHALLASTEFRVLE